ncbi:ribonuclease N [Chryseobacterium nematophagum]|uniref:Ribonuclease n=1 Tax=Chryseobacterium nematophagum TaxID=2305228 RepID=A0A3M7LD15_9FLAO|nr:ribonuclease domain-containing protein [Chryseobacterium nematophagum]RMZ59412.1 ribonuclease N [Chryseobacterium nematophagum]
MNGKIRSLFFICVGLLFGMSVMYIYNHFITDKKDKTFDSNPSYKITESQLNNTTFNSDTVHIGTLTNEKTVIHYLKTYHKLPDYYITKNEAKKLGWTPSKGNLCDVLPGKVIGGDYFGNRENQLPKGKKYFEADINYRCGNRNSDRIIFTKEGEIYLTKNHYKSFTKM